MPQAPSRSFLDREHVSSATAATSRPCASWLKLFTPVSLIGGLIGGILLVQTPSRVFDWLVPFLILFATVLFMANCHLQRDSSGPAAKEPSRQWLWGP